MASLSQRAQQLPVSSIRNLAPLANAAKRAGKTVYYLNIGQPDIHTLAPFMAGVAQAPEVLAYSPGEGLPATREALAAYYALHGIRFDPDQITVTMGGSEAIVFALLATCDPGDEVVVPEPFYANYKTFAKIVDVKINPATTYAEDGFHLPSKAAIEAAVTPKTKAILCCSPGNPTGVVYDREEMTWLRDVALDHDLYLISDEVYREFVYDGLEHVSAFHLDGVDEIAIVVDSISKRYSACGARLGCAASHNPRINEAIVKFAQARLSPPALGEFGLIHLLQAPDYAEQVQAIIERFAARRDALYEVVGAIPGVVCRKPTGAFYVIAKLPVADAADFARWLLTDFDLDGETVMATPAYDFYATPGLGRDELRIAYVLNRHALRRAMGILKAGLEIYQGAAQPAA